MTRSRLSRSMRARRNELDFELGIRGLKFRHDSVLCRNFVHKGGYDDYTSAQVVADKMAEARYLHQFCNYDLGLQIAKNTKGDTMLPRQQWLELIARCVLLTSKLPDYPSNWPWMQRISARDWKQRHDRSHEILSMAINKPHAETKSTQTPAPSEAKAQAPVRSSGQPSYRDVLLRQDDDGSGSAAVPMQTEPVELLGTLAAAPDDAAVHSPSPAAVRSPSPAAVRSPSPDVGGMSEARTQRTPPNSPETEPADKFLTLETKQHD